MWLRRLCSRTRWKASSTLLLVRVRVQHANAAAQPAGHASPAGASTRKDLCVAKLIAHREKDRNFVAALLDADLVNADPVTSRLSAVSGERLKAIELALAWLCSRR